MIIPIGVDDAKVYRTPWMSICLAGFTILVFLITWVAPRKNIKQVDYSVDTIIDYWQARPYLELPGFFVGRFIKRESVLEVKTAYRLSNVYKIGLKKKRIEQKKLDILLNNLRFNLNSLAWIKLSIIPAEGILQPGWISYMFLHAGFVHLFFNMLLFYVVAPMLEDAWGRTLFGLFYISGGIISGIFQAALSTHSKVPILGASGAVSACIGAFAYRFYNRKIKFYYWFLIFLRGSFFIPAWFWAAFWITSEIISLNIYGANNGTALYTHISGFLFGLLFAVLMKKTRIEKSFIEPKLKDRFFWKEHHFIEKADNALSKGERKNAGRLLRQVLTEDKGSITALTKLLYIELEDNNIERSLPLLNRLFSQLLLVNNIDPIIDIVQRFGQKIEIDKLNPSVVLRTGKALETADVLPLADRFYRSISHKGGILTEKAWLKASYLNLFKLHNPVLAKSLAENVLNLKSVHKTSYEQAKYIIDRYDKIKKITCSFAGWHKEGIKVCIGMRKTVLIRFKSIKAVTPGQSGRSIIDISIQRDKGDIRIVRFNPDAFSASFSGSRKESLSNFIAELKRHTKAVVFPSCYGFYKLTNNNKYANENKFKTAYDNI